jgi:hypothetical protein
MQTYTMTKKINIKSKERQESPLEADLKRYGYLLPTNDEELVEFNKIYGDTPIPFPEHLKNPDFLFKKKQTPKKKGKVIVLHQGPKRKASSAEYFKNIVLAAEIANELHSEPTFGHKKFVKVKFLCEEICNMELASNYGKYAAGPLDPKSMYSIDAEFKKQKWFNVVKRDPFGYKYEPLQNVEKYKEYYSRYYSNQASGIKRIIDLFRKEKSDFCEKVATLFAVWKENIQKNESTDETSLFKGFYAWDESKARFTESELSKALKWMRENEIIPILN